MGRPLNRTVEPLCWRFFGIMPLMRFVAASARHTNEPNELQ